MTRLPLRALRAVRSDEAGVTLIELMVAIGLLGVVLGAILSLSMTAERLAPREEARAAVIQETQIGLHKMTRELRQATALEELTPTTVTAKLISGITVSYDCATQSGLEESYKSCLRSATSGGGAPLGSDTVVVDRLVNTPDKPVFDWDDAVPVDQVRYVAARAVVPARGDLKAGHDGDITYESGFYLRNKDAQATP